MAQIQLGVERPQPKTKDQGKRLFSNDKIKYFTKLKIQEYVESFFSKTGSNFSLLSSVSPRFIHYNISRSFDPKTDPTQRRLQIARYFEDLYSVLPSILIIDGGVNPVAHNLGLISDAHVEGRTWRGYYPIVREIPITILTAARDVEEADEMSGLLSLMFNEMRNLAGGNYISGRPEQGETWVVCLPNGPVEVGALMSTEVLGDPVEKIWYAECSLTAVFEDCLAVKREMAEITYGGVVLNEDDLLRNVKKPLIIVPDQIPINTQPTVHIDNFQDSYRVELSGSQCATLDCNLKLTPRKFGKFKIRVVDMAIAHDPSRILAEKEVEIV